jgi:hypothetical protein
MNWHPVRTYRRRMWFIVSAACLLLVGVGIGMLAKGAGARQGSFPRPPSLGLAVKASLGSFCWRDGNVGLCADAPPRKCGQRGVPTIVRRPGQRVELQLGFPPSEVTLTYKTAAGVGKTVRPKLAQQISWAVPSNAVGLVEVLARDPAKGDASYEFCLHRR